MAFLNYVSQDLTSVTVEYGGDMPKDPALVFVSAGTGVITESKSKALANGGKGSADVPFGEDLPSGAYCLLAQTKAAKPEFIAQTVVFFVHKLSARKAMPLWKNIKPAKKGGGK